MPIGYVCIPFATGERENKEKYLPFRLNYYFYGRRRLVCLQFYRRFRDFHEETSFSLHRHPIRTESSGIGGQTVNTKRVHCFRFCAFLSNAIHQTRFRPSDLIILVSRRKWRQKNAALYCSWFPTRFEWTN